VELHDEQQARVVDRLLAANGEAVSFDELRAMGVENPALLCYELAAVGLAIERPREPNGAPALSVRLAPELDLLDRGAHPPANAPPRAARRTAANRHQARADGDPSPVSRRALNIAPVLAGAAMALALVAVAVIALASGGARAKQDSGARVARRRVPDPVQAAQQSARRATPVAGAVDAQLHRGTVSPAAAATLEAEGHRLLEAGSYQSAIAALRGAVQASGGSLTRCAEPDSEACLTFAYALYDLGRALQLDGNSAAAISVLSERLRIDNQREVVEQELSLARAART
jgi:tetratricopeptide (TPR) repeat protein